MARVIKGKLVRYKNLHSDFVNMDERIRRAKKGNKVMKEGYSCSNCGGIVSWISIGKIERCGHCGDRIEWTSKNDN